MLDLRQRRGFTLIELMVVVAIIGILALLGAPEFRTWQANNQVRSIAEALQNDIRYAQAEALRRNRQVALVLTNGTPNTASPSFSPSNPARNWAVIALPLIGSTEGANENSGSTGFISSYVQYSNTQTQITGSVRAICFNSVGRLTASSAITNAANEQCAQPATVAPRTFDIANTNGDRPLRIQIRLGGQIRLCDPARSSSDAPDGC